MTSKLFSLIGGVTTGLVITMAVVIPMPGKRVPVLMTHSGPPAVSRAFEAKDLPDQTPAVVQDARQTTVAPHYEQPLQIPQAPVFTLQPETVLPDQTGRNIALQEQTRPAIPNRVTHQLAQAWEPGSAYSLRYLPHADSGNSPRRPDPGQPGLTGRDGRNPKPPEGPEPTSFGN